LQVITTLSSYEYPFNERIRALLRLEDIFKKVLFHVNAGDQNNHHCALILLLQMLDLIERTDIKVDIMHELDRQILSMQSLIGNPNISTEVLSQTLEDTKESVMKLRAESSKVGQSIRDNEWLMSIKKRASIPGGACQFDLPSYHYWLNQSLKKRRQDFDVWLSQLLPMYESIKIILHLLRSSGVENDCVATAGNYQKSIIASKPAQLLQINMIDDCGCFPEISANKYAINVRFHSMSINEKAQVCNDDIHFKMALCNLM